MNDSFYTQSAEAKNESRTFIPGMKRKSDSPSAVPGQEVESQAVRIELQRRPLAGVLYSVSRDNIGELFPVYIGRNTIGSKPESDIYLTEKSVDGDHAIFLIRKISMGDGSKRVTMSISDYGSEHGTTINGERLEDDVVPVKAGDVIGIGRAYKFYFMPLDSEELGLAPCRDFVATPRVENRPVVNTDYLAYMPPPVDTEVYPTSVGEEDEMAFYGRSSKKKEDHSNR